MHCFFGKKIVILRIDSVIDSLFLKAHYYIFVKTRKLKYMKKIYSLLSVLLLTASVSNAQTYKLYEFDNSTRGNEIASGDTIIINNTSPQYHFRFELGVTGSTNPISSKVRILRINPNNCYTYQLCSELNPDDDFQNNCWDINGNDYMSPTLTNLTPSTQIVFYPKGTTSCNGSTHLRYIVYVNDAVVDSVDYIINTTSLSTPSISKQEDISLSVYPNPVSSWMTVSTQGLSSGFDVKITDVLGKVVFNESVSGATKKLDVSDYKNGVYLVTIFEKGVAVQTRRIVIKH